jgi:hypothetical protein
MTAVTRDAAQVVRLLRRVAPICTNCASLKLSLTPERVAAVAAHLAGGKAVEQTVGRCAVCGRSQAVLSLRK